jgi:hypothetical protein
VAAAVAVAYGAARAGYLAMPMTCLTAPGCPITRSMRWATSARETRKPRVLGAEHPDTLAVGANLAHWTQRASEDTGHGED